MELKKLEPDQVPPVVYQALLLTNDTQGPNAGKLLAYLTNFFNKVEAVANDEEITSEDMIGASRLSKSSLKRAESIVMVHIVSKARIGHPVVKEVLKLLKSAMAAPELVFNPFMLLLCLSLTSLRQHRQVIIESIKGVIGKVIVSNLKKRDNAWYSEEISQAGIAEPFDLMAMIINDTCTYGSWGLIGDGVVGLAFMMLDVNVGLATVKVDTKLKSIWKLGEGLLKVRIFDIFSKVVLKETTLILDANPNSH